MKYYYISISIQDFQISISIQDFQISISIQDFQISISIQDFQILKTSVFHKKTFTGLGMKFDSFVLHQFKTNLISCLIKRAFKICSEETAFNAELSYLQKYFTQNNFPANFVSKMFKKILHNIYNPKPTICVSAAKKPVYFHLPYMGKSSFEIKRQLKTIISRFYPHIQIRFIFTSKFTVGSLFR